MQMQYHNPDMEESSRGPNRCQNAQTLIKCYRDSNSQSFVNAKIRHALEKVEALFSGLGARGTNGKAIVRFLSVKLHKRGLKSVFAMVCQECEALKIASKGPAFFTQAWHLTCRSFKHMCRDLTYYWFRLCVYVMLSIVLGTIFYKVGLSYNAIQVKE